MDSSLLRDIQNRQAQRNLRNTNERVSSRRRKRKPRKRRDYTNIPTSVLDEYVSPSFYNEIQDDFGKLDFKECVLKAEQLGLRIYICGRNSVGQPISTFGHSFGFSPIDSYRYVTKDVEGREIIANCNDSETLQNLEFDHSWCKKEKYMFYFNRGKYHILRYLNHSHYENISHTYLCQGRTFMDRETELMLEEILYGVFEDQYWTVRLILEYCMETKRHALVIHQYSQVTFLVEAPLEECIRVENGKEKLARPVGENVTVVMTRASKLLDRWQEEMAYRGWDAKKMKKEMQKQGLLPEEILANKSERVRGRAQVRGKTAKAKQQNDLAGSEDVHLSMAPGGPHMTSGGHPLPPDGPTMPSGWEKSKN